MNMSNLIISIIQDENAYQDLSESFAVVKKQVDIPKRIDDHSQIPEISQLKSGFDFSEQYRLKQFQEVNSNKSIVASMEQKKSDIILNEQQQVIFTQRTENSVTYTSMIMQSGLYMHENFIQKEGFILKKTKKIFTPFKQIYCHFQDGILSFYEDQNKQRAKFVLNLSLFNFQYYCQQSNGHQIFEFGLKCVNHPKIFLFKGVESNQWFFAIKKFIDCNRKNPKEKFYLNPFDNYYKKRLITNQNFQQMCQTGDIILFQTKSSSCKVQRILTRSNYDHVAMVLRYQSGTILILEATNQNGVGIFDWKSMIDSQWFELYSMVVYRQLQYKRNQEFLQKIEQFVRENLGKQYQISVSKLLKDKSAIFTQQNEDSTYFCSQLIAKIYKKIGFLNQEKSAAQYWPGSFSNEKQEIELQGACFSDEYLIGFNM